MRGALLAAACVLAGCESTQPGAPQVAAGANPGIVEGSQVGAGAGEAPLGALEGAMLAADIGRSLGKEERRIALQAEYEALEYGRPGRPAAWRSEGGASGNIVVGATYTVNRLDCREFTHTVYIGGRARVARGAACRQPDGVWRVI